MNSVDEEKMRLQRIENGMHKFTKKTNEIYYEIFTHTFKYIGTIIVFRKNRKQTYLE
jgi:hypothetical protein